MESVYGVLEEITKKKVLIATPAYDRKVDVPYMMSILDTVRILEVEGYEVHVQIPMQGALLVHARNQILQRFMDLECDYALLVDSDLGWDPQAVLRLIAADKEFSGGVYPARDGKGYKFHAHTEEDGRVIRCPETGLLKMEAIPAGFMLIKRSVVEKMQQKFPELRYEPKNSTPMDADILSVSSGYCLFNTEVADGRFWGEDFVFCRRARECGIDIWVDPTIFFNHNGIEGTLLDALTRDKPN
jgi:glycosyltransferase involved in cell wall biosynthesis